MTVDANVCFLYPGNPIFAALAAMHKVPENWVEAFVSALDIGLENSRGEYFVIMHSDTIVKHPGWVERLLSPFDGDPKCAAAGAWKLEWQHPLYEFTKRLTDTKKAKLWLRRTFLRDSSATTQARIVPA